MFPFASAKSRYASCVPPRSVLPRDAVSKASVRMRINLRGVTTYSIAFHPAVVHGRGQLDVRDGYREMRDETSRACRIDATASKCGLIDAASSCPAALAHESNMALALLCGSCSSIRQGVMTESRGLSVGAVGLTSSCRRDSI